MGSEISISSSDETSASGDELLCGLLKILLETEGTGDVNAELIKASAHEDGHKVEELLQRSESDVNGVFAGYTALHVAAFLGNVEVIQTLIRHNVNMEIQDKNGHRAIHHAAQSGNLAVIELLHNGGADLNACNQLVQTPLQIAVHRGDNEVAKLLLDLGSNPNFKDPSKEDTALHEAIMTQQDDMIELLLKYNADITITNGRGFNVLQLAAMKGNISAVRKLLNKLPETSIVDEKKIDGFAALHLAVFNNHCEVAEVLIKGNANIDIQNNDLQTPLHLAVTKKHIQNVELLVNGGCNINIKNSDGNTPLHYAVENTQEHIFTVLLNGNSDITITNNKGFDVLHFAALRGNLSAVRALLTKLPHPSFVDKQMNGGFTALHISSFNNHLEVTELLIRQGKANMNIGNDNLQSPIFLAVEAQHNQIVRLLVNEGCNVNIPDKDGDTPLHNAVIKGQDKMVSFLLNCMADITLTNNKGLTPLHLAAICGRISTSHNLLSKLPQPSMVDKPNNDGLTALHIAVINNNVEVVWLLVHKGKANMDVQNANLHTPLYVAVGEKHTKIIKILVDAGCNLNIEDKDGDIPLHDTLRFLSPSQLSREDLVKLTKALDISGNDERLMTSLAFFMVANGADISHKNKTGFTPLDLCRDSNLRKALAVCHKERNGSVPNLPIAEGIGGDQESHEDRNDCSHQKGISLPPQKPDPVVHESSKDHPDVKKLQERLKDVTCPICLDRTKNMIFQCGHGTCQQCSYRLSECPICRKTVETRILLH